MAVLRLQSGLMTVFALCLVATADAEQPQRMHDVDVEDYFSIAVVMDCAVSPEGRRVAFTELRWEPPAEKRNLDLWVVDTGTKRRLRLTFDKASDSAPQWSPDGRYIYFLSNQDRGEGAEPPYNGKPQVWRISPEGGEPQSVTREKDGVGLFSLSGDGAALYYTVSEEQIDDEWKDLRSTYKDLEYGHGATEFSQVWKLDLESWRSTKVVDEKRVVGAMQISPDEKHIALVTTPDETLLTNEGWSRVDVVDVSSGAVSTVTPDGWRDGHPSRFGWIGNIAWSSDSAALAFSVDFDGYATRLYAVEWLGEETALHELMRPEGVSVSGGTVAWGGGSRDVCFVGEEGARSRLYCLSEVKGGSQGAVRTETPGDVAVGSFHYPRSGGQPAVVMGTLTHPPDVFLVQDGGRLERLTTVNPQVDTWKLPQISVVSWTGANGDAVEGILELPPDHQPGTSLPMIVELHGGPTAATLYRLRFWIYGRTLLPAKGYALLSPNYRGSTGYGDKFLTELIGRENDIEVEDILKGVDAMVERGIADPDRLGVMGWSNGGFLTNCLITKTDRFKAASSGAGVLHQVMQWGTEDTPGHVINYMEDLPWADREAYGKGSPLYDLDKVKTPTLIHVGEKDARVPAAHSRTLYRALKHYLHVPTELVVYPGEGHGLTTYTHRKAKMEWDLKWFERYVLGTGEQKLDAGATN